MSIFFACLPQAGYALKIKEFTIVIDCFQNKPACHVRQE
jgi:hypothetical protein